MLSRNFRLKFDLSNYNIFDIPKIHFCLMDTDSSVLYVELTNEGNTLNLTDMMVMLYISKPDGTEVVIECTYEDIVNGLVRFDLPRQALSLASSNYNAEIRVIQSGRCVVTRPFNYSVFENLSFSDLQMVSSNEYVLLVDSLRRLSTIESNENLRCQSEIVREKQELDRQESIKRMNINSNYKIAELETVKTDVINTKNSMVSEVNTKVSEVDSKMVDITNRFNALSPEESTNAEVQLSRVDISGFEHESLKNRLDKIELQPPIMYEIVEG